MLVFFYSRVDSKGGFWRAATAVAFPQKSETPSSTNAKTRIVSYYAGFLLHQR